MFSRFRPVLRAASNNVRSNKFGKIPRTSASASNGGNTRQLASSATLLAGAIGTVVLYKLTTSANIIDSDSLSSYFSELLQQISPCKCHGPHYACM
jgi:hypothetical protein